VHASVWSPLMAAAATPEPPTGVSLIELALGARRRSRGVLTHAGESFGEALSYCCRCEVRAECLESAFALGQQAVGVWGGTSARERRDAKRRGLTPAEVLAELG